jgi:GT2 family glycosyltransferase
MKFSIVITTFNRLEFLKRAIATCQAQTVGCEIIVVDDCSSDGTAQYLKSLGNQVVYLRNPQNLGHSGSVNAGVAIATGDWIKFLDDDDYLASTCIEQMQIAIARHPEAVLCSCLVVQVDARERELRRSLPFGPGHSFYIPQALVHYGMLLDLVPYGTPVQVAARRDAFLQTGGWDTTMTNFDDIDAWIRIAEHGDALFINQYLAYRTLWPGGFDQKKDLACRLHLNLQIKERIRQHIPDLYQPRCPSAVILQRYLELHWGLVALKQHKWLAAFELGFPAILMPAAWQPYLEARRVRKQANGRSRIPKYRLD